MSTQPPTGTPLWQVIGNGVRPVLFRTSNGNGQPVVVSTQNGARRYDAARRCLVRDWSMVPRLADSADLFATEHAARQEFEARRAAAKRRAA